MPVRAGCKKAQEVVLLDLNSANKLFSLLEEFEKASG